MIPSRRTFLHQAACLSGGLILTTPANGKPALTKDRFGVLQYSFGIQIRQGKLSNDPLKLIPHAIEQGFGGIQMGLGSRSADEIKAIRAVIDKQDAFLEGIVRPPTDEKDLPRFEAELKTASEMGINVIRTAMLSGRRYETFKKDDEYRAFKAKALKSMESAEPLAARHKVRLAVENHKDFRADEMAAMLKKVSSANLGICLDTGNNIALLDDPWKTIDVLAPWTFTVHFKDMAVEEYADGFLLAEVPLGEGCLDLKRIVQRVSKENPKARFNLEMMTRDPLRIPCLTDGYWETFADVPGHDLARTLGMVKKHKREPQSLPRITAMPVEKQLASEQSHVTRSVEYARKNLFA